MTERPKFEWDDENDTRLFEKLEAYVIEHYPNPERLGCLDPSELEALVKSPEKLNPGDQKYLHIFKCAECTLTLRRLRKAHAQRPIGKDDSRS